MKKYFIHNGTEQQGPFDLEELKSKNLRADSMIWFEGLKSWMPLSAIDELKEVLGSTPPPFESKAASPPPSPPRINTDQGKAEPPKKRSSIGKRLLLITGILALLLIGVFVFNLISYQQKQEADERYKETIRNNISTYVTAERNEYLYSGLGGIYGLKITVSNTSGFLIDKVVVRITYIKADGNVWDTKDFESGLIPSGGNTVLSIPDTERGTSVKYEVVKVTSAELGLW